MKELTEEMKQILIKLQDISNQMDELAELVDNRVTVIETTLKK